MPPPSTQLCQPRQSLEPLRFVILAHDHPSIHWDILLQEGNRLLGWRGDDQGHFLNGGEVVQTSDHRLIYLDYEGPLSGQRGTVRRIDGGPLKWRHLKPEEVVAEIQGHRWHGLLQLRKIKASVWLARFSKD